MALARRPGRSRARQQRPVILVGTMLQGQRSGGRRREIFRPRSSVRPQWLGAWAGAAHAGLEGYGGGFEAGGGSLAEEWSRPRVDAVDVWRSRSTKYERH
jgi:hypothetical protein